MLEQGTSLYKLKQLKQPYMDLGAADTKIRRLGRMLDPGGYEILVDLIPRGGKFQQKYFNQMDV